MFGRLILLFLIYFLSVEGAKRFRRNCAFGLGNFQCEGRDDGLYANHLRGCHQYFNCTNGTDPSFLFCPPDKPFFDDSVKSCVAAVAEDTVCGLKFPPQLNATVECRGRLNGVGVGFVADLESRCRRFAICYNQDSMETFGFWQECPGGQRFDLNTSSCKPYATVKCPCIHVCPVGLVCD